MRDIKFRAWDNYDHEMYKKENPPNRMTYYDNPKVFDDGWLQFDCAGQTAIGDHGENRHTLMQYTSLKDKNKKDIYEADLLRHNGKIYKVIWTHGGFGLVNIENELDYASFHNIDLRTEKNPDGFEVIGNIYLNPELLLSAEDLDAPSF